MPTTADPLYLVFEKHLKSGQFDQRPEQDLIDAVVDEFLAFLVRQGAALHKGEKTLREDIAQEVRDMLKMKIYGHYDVRHYNLAKKKLG